MAKSIWSSIRHILRLMPLNHFLPHRKVSRFLYNALVSRYTPDMDPRPLCTRPKTREHGAQEGESKRGVKRSREDSLGPIWRETRKGGNFAFRTCYEWTRESNVTGAAAYTNSTLCSSTYVESTRQVSYLCEVLTPRQWHYTVVTCCGLRMGDNKTQGRKLHIF